MSPPPSCALLDSYNNPARDPFDKVSSHFTRTGTAQFVDTVPSMLSTPTLNTKQPLKTEVVKAKQLQPPRRVENSASVDQPSGRVTTVLCRTSGLQKQRKGRVNP